MFGLLWLVGSDDRSTAEVARTPARRTCLARCCVPKIGAANMSWRTYEKSGHFF